MAANRSINQGDDQNPQYKFIFPYPASSLTPEIMYQESNFKFTKGRRELLNIDSNCIWCVIIYISPNLTHSILDCSFCTSLDGMSVTFPCKENIPLPRWSLRKNLRGQRHARNMPEAKGVVQKTELFSGSEIL